MEKQYRHGDVFVREIAAISPDANPVDKDRGRVVLAYGEVTGHSHFIATPRARMFRDDGSGGRRFLDTGGEVAALRHEEHTTIVLPAGKYEISIQREYSPEAVRNVLD